MADVRDEVARVAAEQDDGQGCGETAWDADAATVLHVHGDWQDARPIEAAFLELDGVDAVVSEAEALPTGWCDAEVVYPDPPPAWVVKACADESALVAVGALSTMICVKPRPDEAAAIADPDGDDPSTLHVTLCYLGDVDGDLGHVVEALGPVGATHAPLAGTVAGVGMFTATPSSDGLVPAILLPDVPGLVELRVAVTEALQRAGIDYSRVHGFQAHITLEYLDPAPEGEPVEHTPFRDDQAGAPLHFDEILVVRSDVEVVPVPLTGATPLTAAALTAAGEGFCLPREVRLRTDPVRQAFLRTVMTPPLEAAGLSFDVTNPLAANVLAQSGSHVVGISETTQADLMRVIQAAHDEGLSIPDTAHAIRAHMTDMASTRATTIARTELAAAANGGSLAATKIVADETGDSYFKQWMTAPGAAHPRHEDYEGLDGQTVSLEGYFEVGDSQLQFPGDPAGDPGETINCRCALSYSGDASEVEGMENMDAAGPPHPVHAHNAVIKRAYERVDELEPRLAAVLEPILRRAGEVAAANFEAYATDHLTAAGDWTPPSGEEILPIACDHPGAIRTATQPSAARAAATAILHDAARAEPDVTSALQAISRRAGGEMAGLDFRVKSEASLARKIESKVLANPGVTPDQVAGRINDALRYTMNFQPDRYGAGVQAAISDLERAGFKPLEVENYWGPQSPEYKGINAVFEAPHGQRFELQFHTPQSFALKNGANHQLYESFRTTTAAPDRVHLWDQMTENASRLDVPAGAGDVGLPVGHAAPVAEAAPFRADIGVTPFRSATDEAVGFYDSPKFAQFLGDVHESADAYGVQVDGIDRVTGIWQGETEPSVSLRAHDGEAGVRAFAANLGQAYNQDGVLIFSDAHAGDVMATFEKSVTQSEATDLMRKVGIDGGRFTEDGKLQIIGSGPEFVQQLDELAAEMGSRYQAAVGRFELLDRDAGQYREALRQFAGATA